jgi:tetratricopeptide (TPR) repeat protein
VRALKWITHPVSLLLIIVVIALYINRETLFPNLSRAGESETLLSRVESAIDALQAKVKPAAPSDGGEEADIVFGKSGDNDMPAYVAATGASAAQGQMPPSNGGEQDRGDGDTKGGEVLPAQGGEGTVRDARAVSALPAEDTGTATGSDVIGPVTGAADAASPLTSESSGATDTPSAASADTVPGVSREQLLYTWRQARLAAWHGDLDTAIKHYQTLITLQPDNIDAYGEMGNVMLRMGKTEGAAEAYYQAARRLGNTHRRMMAWQLLNVIARLSPPRAEKLYQELMPR